MANPTDEQLRDMTRPAPDAPVIEAEGAMCHEQCIELEGDVTQVINPNSANY